MFSFSAIPELQQERQKCLAFENYVKILYNDPDLVQKYDMKPVWTTERFKSFAQSIKDFKIRSDDVWVVSYPKTGTTLTLEMVSILLSGCDFDKIQQKYIMDRVNFFEIGAQTTGRADGIKQANEDPYRRIMKTHLNLNLLPRELINSNQGKIILVWRAPPDAAVSYFHHHKNIQGYGGGKDEFFEDYLTGEQIYGSYFRFAEEYLQFANERENVLQIRYEDMLQDTDRNDVIRRIADFRNIPIAESDVARVSEFVSFDQMSQRENSNMQKHIEILKKNRNLQNDYRFLRSGKAKSYEKEMPAEFIEKFSQEIKKWKRVQEVYPDY